MLRRVLVSLVPVAAAACTHQPPPAPHPAPAATACPDASRVALAAWSPPDDDSYGGVSYGHPAAGHWGIRLGHLDEGGVPYGPLSGEQVDRLGLAPVTGPVWIMRPGEAPCRATVAEHVAELVDVGPISTMVSAVSHDCAPADTTTWSTGWAVQAERVDGCNLVVPREVGRVQGEERDTGFYLPPGPAPVPEPWATAVGPARCAPACVTLWSIDEAPGRPAISEATVTRITPGEPDEACGWDSDTTFAHYLRGDDGAVRPLPLPRFPDQEWQGDMSLAGVLADGEVPRVVMFTDVATWAAFDLGGDGTLAGGRRVSYFVPHEEDFTFRSLAPYCGP